MKFKQANKLFLGRYRYKIVLVSPGVHAFRSGILDQAFKQLSTFTPHDTQDHRFYNKYLTEDNITYLFDIYEILLSATKFSVRVETPWLSIYSNSLEDINKLKDLNLSKVKSVYETPENLLFGECVSKLPYDYKISIKRPRVKDDLISFYDWAITNKNVKLTKSCKRCLKGESYSVSSYFYVKGDHNLTMCRVHLGSSIKNIEKIVNQLSIV